MKLRRKNLLLLVHRLNRLFTSFGLQQCKSDIKLSIIIVEKCLRWATCEGHPGLKRFKTFSWLATRAIMGISETSTFSSVHKRHLNKVLVKASVSDLSRLYWISIFNVHRLFKLDPVIDTTTITSGFKGSLWSCIYFMPSLYQVTLSFRSKLKLDQNWSARWKWHISGASGPNGPVAYTRYLEDLYAVRLEWILWKNVLLLWSLPLCNRRETFEALKDAVFDSHTRYRGSDKQFIHSRLAFLSDKSGKTRVIAIGDILSQSCLKLVHQRCNRILRKLRTDGTFDQDKQRLRVKRWTEDNVFLSSIDLTAVTDRLPAIYQLFVIISTRVLTPLQGIAWFLVTVKRTFTFKTVDGPKYVRYKVGQPMGMLSSWPVMAISHHMLVWWAYKLTYPDRDPKNFEGYCILGDDLVIRDKYVAKSYLQLISALGVDYSVEKSFFSIGLAEFAKSLFLRGRDLTPFPLGALNFEKNALLSNIQVILTECSKRNLRTTLSTIEGISPSRWRGLVRLTALSPLSPKSVLDVQSRKDHGIFFSFLLIERIRYFSRLATVRDSTHAFAFNDPGKSGKYLASPYLQIGKDNGERYPVRRLRDTKRLVDPVPILGEGWIAYCSQSWPDGLPLLGDEKLVPGPTFAKEFDDPVVRSSLQKLEKVLPGYFTVRCVGPQVGE